MAYLNIQQLKKSYGSNLILKGISLEIGRGQFVSVLGPSGSGKTTFLRCLAGLETPDSGRLELDGTLLSDTTRFVPPEKRGLGMVFQNYAVWPHLNVWENVAFPLRVRKTLAAELQARVTQALDLVRLPTLKHRYPHELSGGQQQRVALARALAMSPKLLLLDEPLSNLDALLREELGGEIRRLSRELGLTTVLVTHDQKEALSLSDRILVLNAGVVEADGSAETLYHQPPTPFVAEFISGGQHLTMPNGGRKLVLPRRWRIGAGTAANDTLTVEIRSRIFLGSEYEYWGAAKDIAEPVRFFSAQKLEMGATVVICPS